MNWEFLANSKLIENLGWTLLYSLWQIALIALVLFLARQILRGFSANARYTAAVFALVLAAALPVITFIQFSRNESPRFSQTANSSANPERRVTKDLRNAEDFSAVTKTKPETDAADGKGAFGAIANLQTVFNENFAAFLPFAVGFWLLGVMFSGARLTGGMWQLHVYKTRKIEAPDAEWQEKFSALCERLKIT